ncbi:Rieske (2Fe-2S) protein [Streptomyces brasiliensis]|uniref:Cytochrome bc1 complex Rieske iron-sulfur subunit n=1 Tax=Streptomyces brasiliensis TaxID=1954 RepID=A0A917NJN4_9ACTN|nr:Rieske (2Fe-2S) protein [Streptomyces brasiliensis]GGJ02738.1 iron-sulfur protein [Streptomyces brasiliensis]
MTDSATRRSVLATGAAALAVGCVGCGSESGDTKTEVASETATESAPGSTTAAAAGQELTRTSDIPVGGGRVFEAEKVVVTQPSQGRFKAFSALCTHQGCTVAKVANGTIDCACHGSKFHVADGSVANGPAMQPLAPANITVDGNSIRLA